MNGHLLLRRFVQATLLACALLAGCAPRPASIPETTLPGVASEALLQLVKTSGTSIQTVRGLAKVKLVGKDRSVGFSQVLLVAFPDRLRAESLSPFGSPLLILASDGSDLEVLLPGEGRFLQGPASAENLRRFTRIPLRLADLVSLLLYRPLLLSWDSMRQDGDGRNLYRLILDGPQDRRQVFTFDAGKRLIGAAYYHGTDLLLEVKYGDFLAAAPLYPQRVELSVPGSGIDATVRFQDVALNVNLPADRFRLQPPAGARVEEFPTGGG